MTSFGLLTSSGFFGGASSAAAIGTSLAPVPCRKLFGQTHRDEVLAAFRAFAADAASGLQLLKASYHACLSDCTAVAACVAHFLKHETRDTAKMTAAVDRSIHYIKGIRFRTFITIK